MYVCCHTISGIAVAVRRQDLLRFVGQLSSFTGLPLLLFAGCRCCYSRDYRYSCSRRYPLLLLLAGLPLLLFAGSPLIAQDWSSPLA